MSKKPPNRPGIAFEVGARLEAQDYLQKWYPSRIEKIDYEEGKMLVHFERWSHRYDEWIYWDSSRLRPLERPALRKEGLKDEEELYDFKAGEEVLARWTDCRYYPAKIETINKEGTYTVQFYDGVIRCLKKMHIKSMPEDAKGQDWIALVKAAAAAAAKNKTGNKPRTSANSNKDREERKWFKISSKKEETSAFKANDEIEEEKEEPTSSGRLDLPLKDVPRIALEHAEAIVAQKRKINQGSSFQAKRARLNKITGLLASKAIVVDDGEKKDYNDTALMLEQEISPKPPIQKRTEADLSSSANTQKPTVLSPALSTGKARSKKIKHESGDSSGCKMSPKSPAPLEFMQGEDLSLVPQLPSSPMNETSSPQPMNLSRSSGRSQRRRRSQRLAISSYLDDSLEKVSSPSSVTDGKELPNNSQTQQDLSVPEVPDVAHVSPEKLEPSLPLDLSRSVEMTAPLVPESTVHNECPSTEKEDIQITYSSKQVTDGRVASTASVIAMKKTEDISCPKELLVDLDHNKFKCRVQGCSKAFRKAKLLDYHLKYYHSTDKEVESETNSPERAMRTRATSATVPTSTLEYQEAKRQRTVSSSSLPSSHVHALHLEMPLTNNLKLPKGNKKKRSSTSVSSEGTEIQLFVPGKEKSFENLQEKMLKKMIEKDKHSEVGVTKTERKVKLEEKSSSSFGKKKEKEKERKEKKEKDHFKSKQKKKKKKKKKSKQPEYSDFEESSLEYLERCTSPVTRSSSSSLMLRNMFTMKNTSYQFPRAILSIDLSGENLSDMELLDDSSTESLLLSGDEYNRDFDSINFEESQDEEDAINEIVRCICEMDEENGFMIQCEECLCWQHSVCMGLLEDSIPEQYICYICRDPPGQRWSAKYRYDKDWLSNGHMCGLSFLNENYSHLNAKKIVSTHHLLADMYGVTEILHGLQLKIGILKNKEHPDLHFWACSGTWKEQDQVTLGVEKKLIFDDTVSPPERTLYGHTHKEQPSLPQKMEETYIISEHSYQKPSGFNQDCKSANDPASSEDEETSSFDEEEREYLPEDKKCLQYSLKEGAMNEQNSSEGNRMIVFNEKEAGEQMDSHLQWQLNLLTHIENVQNEVTSRMDLIEKEVDVLESWLDFTGELEPPDPLARLPQLKRRIKQLLTDMGKVQQIAALCSV
ncbi:PHD finger protein 20-like protein 1 isoform X2 [Rhinatrema bivittatum]|uniref:PHD finger protein 20-like protein 1 isoform X2 n=1 Tax=Rhinatrema bivittatum TaxID=194408 RepID=UPI00112B309C|nr:PHD finger protein 20-like protein 1 isoform X2 [Rhinatrema bivittatum]